MTKASINFLFLLISICLYDVINGKSTLKKIIKVIPSQNPLESTTNPGKALLIFNRKGLGTDVEKKLYVTRDSRTGLAYGDGICKQVIKRMDPEKSFKKVVISYKGRISSRVYEHGNDKIDDEFYKLYGVKCYYGDDELDYIFVCNAPEKFPKKYYYIFTPKLDGQDQELEIQACLSISKKKSDYPKIKVEETSNSKTADRIFGKHGTLSIDEKKHVCKPISDNSPELRGQEVCQNVLQQREDMTSFKFIEASCDKRQITRQILKHLKPSVEFKRTGPHDLVKCTYEDENRNLKYIWVLNTSKKRFYYVFEEIPIHGLIVKSCLQL